MFARLSLALLVLVGANAMAAQRWVPPPAPPVVDGKPIRVQAQMDERGGWILHLPKSRQTDPSRVRYRVTIKRSGQHFLEASLESVAFAADDELVFVNVAPGSESEYEIEVIDGSVYPLARVFRGSLAFIPKMEE
jgi:hypothetical protein